MNNDNWKNFNIDEELKTNNQAKKGVFSYRIKVLILLFLCLSLVLINLKFIEVLSLADGEVIPQSRIKYIQHLEGGIVEEILIEEGENVKSNQPLVVLSKAKASSEYEEIQSRLNSIELSIFRINAEKKSLSKIPEEDLTDRFDNEQIKLENELLLSRKKNIDSEQKTMKKNIKNIEKRYELVKEKTDISEKLLKAEATNRFKHLELLGELSNLEGQLDEQKSKLETLLLNFNQELNSELSQLKKEKSELVKRIKKYSDSLNRTILKSPVSGIVKFISVNSKGAIVAPGVTVVEIVPEDDRLIIEARLPLSEIGYVKNGLNTKIRLNSSEGSRFKPISGKVVFVGADRISADNQTGYYLVKIETDQNSFVKGNEIYKLYSGVPVAVGIITGRRSFLDYFLSPFLNKITFSLSER